MKVVAYLMRHGEVEHHLADLSLTPRGRAQAEAAGAAFAARLADGDTASIYHSPLSRVQETAGLFHASLRAALKGAGREGRVRLAPPQLDPALHGGRFFLGPGREPQEPSLLYTTIHTPAYLGALPPAQANYYRGFWASHDAMEFWMTRDSHGGAETVETVWGRVQERLCGLFADGFGQAGPGSPPGGRAHWIGITHSGTMRVVLQRAFGQQPGGPDFCEAILIEPSAQPGQAAASYRGRAEPLDLAGPAG